MKRRLILLAVLGAALGGPVAASATTGYGSASDGPASGAPASHKSSLPFTGVDLEIVAGCGLGLLGLGLALRRGTRSTTPTD